MGVTVHNDDDQRRRAPYSGTYRIGTNVYGMRAGDPIPDEAEIVESAGDPDERAKGKAPQNRSRGRAPENRAKKGD